MDYLSRLFSSFRTTFVLLLVLAAWLALATVFEKYFGTEAAKAMFYYSPILFLLFGMLILNFFVACAKHHCFTSRKIGLILVHSAFVVILIGAYTTHLFGEEGMMHIREGETSNKLQLMSKTGESLKILPFSLKLNKFTLERYPGSNSPSSYTSNVEVIDNGNSFPARIYMNNVLDVKGYRFFQASFDEDEAGTVLSVNHDVVGRNITYCGYLLLFIGLIVCFVGKHSRFRQLTQKLREMKTVMLILAGLLVFASAKADIQLPENLQNAVVPLTQTEEFSALTMQSRNGRMMPIGTFASEVLRKLTKEDKIGPLNASQFLISLLAMPQEWSNVKLFSVGGQTFSYNDLFDAKGNYRLSNSIMAAYSKRPESRTKQDKELLKTDEKVNTFQQLIEGKMLNLFPLNNESNKWFAAGDDLSSFGATDSAKVLNLMNRFLTEVHKSLQNNQWANVDAAINDIGEYQQANGAALLLQPEKVKAELLYNRINIFRYCKIGYNILGGLLLLFSFLLLFHHKMWMRRTFRFVGFLVAIIFIVHTAGMGLRWYIGGYAPWSNSYETMVYVAWATVFGGLCFARRSNVAFAVATLFGGIILFVSSLNWMDPQINPLVPVLKSPWLMFHVAVVTAAYGFFGISFLLGLVNLILMCKPNGNKEAIDEISIINEMSLWCGLALMTIGTFLGAVWANVSWGNYWSWDPKETWALITLLVYAAVTHVHLLKSRHANLWFNLLSVLAFATVLMTFFGVNFLLSGMHSYGQM